MEITGVTFVTLIFLIIATTWFAGWLLVNLWKHDKMKYSTLNEPLKNKGKPWYNK